MTKVLGAIWKWKKIMVVRLDATTGTTKHNVVIRTVVSDLLK